MLPEQGATGQAASTSVKPAGKCGAACFVEAVLKKLAVGTEAVMTTPLRGDSASGHGAGEFAELDIQPRPSATGPVTQGNGASFTSLPAIGLPATKLHVRLQAMCIGC